jgi:hypothetical protein
VDQQQPENSDDGEEEGEEEGCRRKCNDELRMGMDMVKVGMIRKIIILNELFLFHFKAHSAFGSIGVPSVVEQLDLLLFCRLDAAHDQCLIRFVRSLVNSLQTQNFYTFSMRLPSPIKFARFCL